MKRVLQISSLFSSCRYCELWQMQTRDTHTTCIIHLGRITGLCKCVGVLFKKALRKLREECITEILTDRRDFI